MRAFSSARYERESRVSRSEEHTSELQSHVNLVCRLLLEKKKANWKSHKEMKKYVASCTMKRPWKAWKKRAVKLNRRSKKVEATSPYRPANQSKKQAERFT